jgi:hypothetical protein
MKSIIAAALAVLCITAAHAAPGRRSADGNAVDAQSAKTVGPAPTLPPLSMTCPMHPDVIESRPGSCPLCKMSLVPVRLETAHMCPVHTTVMSDAEGTCRLCRRQLIPVTVSVTWTCVGQPGIDRMEPGKCPDGSAMIRRRTLRPHGNHNPQHGGQFFMAPDNWHHLEGTYPRDRTFRLYLYDDFARPLPPAEMKRVQARVVTRETYDAATRKTTDVTAFPLRLSRDGAYFEARVDPATLPAEMTAKVRFKPEAPEYRFDFTFGALTKEPAAPRASTRAAPRVATPAPRNATGGTAAAVPPRAAPAPAPSPEQETGTTTAESIPETVPAILEQLQRRDGEVRELIAEGNFAAVWVPAFQAKDLAVALEPHLGHLAPEARASAEPAIQRVVRFAWLLDAFGDVGNRQQLESAYSAFASAVADAARAFAETP